MGENKTSAGYGRVASGFWPLAWLWAMLVQLIKKPDSHTNTHAGAQNNGKKDHMCVQKRGKNFAQIKNKKQNSNGRLCIRFSYSCTLSPIVRNCSGNFAVHPPELPDLARPEVSSQVANK